MDRYYRRNEFEGNVLTLWRDHEAEALAADAPCLNGECDAEIADYVMGVYLCAQLDGFQQHPEFQSGIVLCCESQDDAAHMAGIMAQFTQETIPYQVTWLGKPNP